MALGIAGYAVRMSLGVPGDSVATARNIAAAERLYRLSVVGDLLGVVTVLVVSWALYVLLRRAQSELALLGLLLRLVENAILAVAAIVLLGSLPATAPADYLASFQAEQAFALARLARGTYASAFNVGFVFLGAGSAVFAFAMLRASLIPRWMASGGIVASLLLAAGAATSLVVPGLARSTQLLTFPLMFVWEVGLGLWLLVRGVPSLAAPANVGAARD